MSPPDLYCQLPIPVFTAGPLHCQLPITVFTARPLPPPPDSSVHCRTSTASSRSQSSPPDLYRHLPIPVFTAGPLLPAPDPSVHCRTSTASSRLKFVPKRMPEIILLRVIPTMTFVHFVTGKPSGILLTYLLAFHLAYLLVFYLAYLLAL